MKKVFVASVFFASIFVAVASASAITVRSMADQRIWQTRLNAADPLRWPWIAGADSATVSFSSLCDGRVQSVTVEKQLGDICGTCGWPSVASGEERLYDLTLSYRSGEDVIETHTARVALLPGVNGGSGATVRDSSSPEWGAVKVKNPMFAYDAAWVDGDVSAASIVRQAEGGSPVETGLSGTSGYDVVSAISSPSLSLLFDGVTIYSGLCNYMPYGMIMFVR